MENNIIRGAKERLRLAKERRHKETQEIEAIQGIPMEPKISITNVNHFQF